MRQHQPQPQAATSAQVRQPAIAKPSSQMLLQSQSAQGNRAMNQAIELQVGEPNRTSIRAKPLFRGLSSELAGSSHLDAPIQAKLAIGQSNDKYEQEADRVAEEVIQHIQKPGPGDMSEASPVPEIQAVRQVTPRASQFSPMKVHSAIESGIQQARGQGQRLPDRVRVPMEQAFGADFSGVKIHAGGYSDQLNRSLQARAFTTGQDIFFRQGEYQPDRQSGQEMLAHELTHTLQQNPAPTASGATVIQRIRYSQKKGHKVNNDYDTDNIKDFQEKVTALAQNDPHQELNTLYDLLKRDIHQPSEELTGNVSNALKFVERTLSGLPGNEQAAPQLPLELGEGKQEIDDEQIKDKSLPAKSGKEAESKDTSLPANSNSLPKPIEPPKAKKEFGDEDKQNILSQIKSLDYELLTQVASKEPPLQVIDGTDLDIYQKALIKQIILVSSRPASKLKSILDKAIHKNADQLKQFLQRQPTADKEKEFRQQMVSSLIGKLGTDKVIKSESDRVYSLIARCHQIVNDLYRLGGTLETLDKVAKTDATEIKHYEKGRFSSVKKTHTVADIQAKVKTVAQLSTGILSTAYMPIGKGEEKQTLNSEKTKPLVAVAGGGPVGLMAAIEARLQGAQVVVFEGREQEYSRRQVLKLEDPTMQKLRKFGVYEELFDQRKPKENKEIYKGNKDIQGVAVKYIEKALRRRAEELGIKIEKGFYLTGAQKSQANSKNVDLELKFFPKNQSEQTSTKQSEQTKTVTVDLLIVAVGPGIAKRNQKTGIALKDVLGFDYDVKNVVDYAVAGLLKPVDSKEGKTGPLPGVSGWKYRFDTDKVTYLLHQIPKDLYDKFAGPDGEESMQKYIIKAAEELHEIENLNLADSQNKRNERTPNVGIFKIEIQQAKQFVSKILPALVIGDSAATPHPDSGSGFNAGVAELDALGDVIWALRQERIQELEAREQPDSGHSAEQKQEKTRLDQAFEQYNREMKQLTDTLVNKAMGVFKKIHFRRTYDLIKSLEEQYATYPSTTIKLGEMRKEALELYDKRTDQEQSVNRLLDMQTELEQLKDSLFKRGVAPKNALAGNLRIENPDKRQEPQGAIKRQQKWNYQDELKKTRELLAKQQEKQQENYQDELEKTRKLLAKLGMK